MNNCSGIFGKLFGHKFENTIVNERFIANVYEVESIRFLTAVHLGKIPDTLKILQNEYALLCKRCGYKKEANNG